MKRVLSILAVEDDEVDIEALHRVFRKQNAPWALTHARNGVEALAILRKKSDTVVDEPFIILLDLNMPQMGGLEFLKNIRRDDELKDLEVVILTTSDHDKDKEAAAEYKVAGYILKSEVDKDFNNLLSLIEELQKKVA